MAVPLPRRGGVMALVALVAVATVEAAPLNEYRNIVNRKFATVTSGPLNALVVDLPANASPAEARAAVAARVRAAVAERASALETQSDLLRRFPPFRGSGAPVAPTAFDGVVVVRSNGKLVGSAVAGGAARAKRVGTASLGGRELNFRFEGWTAAERSKLETFLAYAYPAVRQVYGAPATSGTVRVVRDANIAPALRNGGGYYNASLGEIHLFPSDGFPTDAEQVNLNFLHLIVRAFHGDAFFRYDAWETGFARAATLAALEVIDPAAEAPKPGGSIVQYTDYHLIQLYDLLNQPALGNDRFISGSGWDGMFLWRAAMATAAWLKVYAERRDFFARFNEAYYARYTPELAGNVPALVALAATLLPDGVEGLPFAEWYRRQHVLDTSVTPGTKLFVYNAPRFPTRESPPSRDGWTQTAMLHYFRTDGRTGSETPLSGIAYPIAWSWQYDRELPLEPQDQKVIVQNGIGLVTPTFFNIGDPTAQRVTIDYCIGGESVRTYLPVTYTGVEPNWNDLFGVIVGDNVGVVRAQLEGGGVADLTVTQGGFGGRLAGGALSQISRALLTCTVGSGPAAQVVSRRVNTGYDYYVAVCSVGDAAPRRLSRTIAAGIRMLSVPGTPFRFDPLGDLGLTGGLALAHWNPRLAPANKYEVFPLAPPFQPGRGFWVKLPSERPLQVEGAPTDPTATVAVSAPAGWNQIGCPREERVPLGGVRVKYQEREIVSLATAMANGWLAPKIWKYTPGVGYQIATTLDAWDACWLKVNVADGVSLIFPPVRASGASVTSLAGMRAAGDPEGWRMRLVATADGGVSEVTIGASRGATSGFDARFDQERPPSVDGMEALPVHLRVVPIVRGWSPRTVLDLDTDVRAPGAAHERWLLEARTVRPQAAITLTITAEGRLPRWVRLCDVRSGRRWLLEPGELSLSTGPDGVVRWLIETSGPSRP